MHAQLNLHLIFNRGEAYFSGAANLKIAQLRSLYDVYYQYAKKKE